MIGTNPVSFTIWWPHFTNHTINIVLKLYWKDSWTTQLILCWNYTERINEPLSHHILLPLRMKCLPSSLSTALVLMELASEPLAGSVRQKAAIFSPDARSGRYFSFCSGEPYSRMPLNPMDWWAPSVMPTPRSNSPTTSTRRAYCREETGSMHGVNE